MKTTFSTYYFFDRAGLLKSVELRPHGAGLKARGMVADLGYATIFNPHQSGKFFTSEAEARAAQTQFLSKRLERLKDEVKKAELDLVVNVSSTPIPISPAEVCQ